MLYLTPLTSISPIKPYIEILIEYFPYRQEPNQNRQVVGIDRPSLLRWAGGNHSIPPPTAAFCRLPYLRQFVAVANLELMKIQLPWCL